MEFDLSRIDYTIADVTCPGCVKLLPAEAELMQQKVVIGDCKGVLQAFLIKNEEPFIGFKTLPGKEITCMQLAGATGSPADKIFIASGNEIKGFTKKGKVFFSLESSLSEKITSLYIHGNNLIVSSMSMIVQYKDATEVGNYMCEDRVLDLVAVNGKSPSKLNILVTLVTKCVLLLENTNFVSKIQMKCGPICLLTPFGYGQNSREPVVLFGAKDGSIGLLDINKDAIGFTKTVEGHGLGSVSCLSFWSGPGNYLLVGRHDGSVQIFQIDPENIKETFKVKFSYFCGEAVTSVVGGCVGNPGVTEVIVATYSGRIFGLRPNEEGGDSQKAVALRIAKLEAEVAKLEKQVLQEREKYQNSTRSSNENVLSAPPILSIADELSGMDAKGWQELSLSSVVPIDMVLIYCRHKLELQTESAAVISMNPFPKTDFIATVRCQGGTMQISLKLKPQERPMSEVVLKVYVIPSGAPRIARLKTYSLGCLAAYSVDDSLESIVTDNQKSWCVLNVNGAFSAAEMSAWLSHLLPGNIPRPTSKLIFVRKHCLTGTTIVCQYQRASAVFRSDDISTIYILKTVLSNLSINKKITLDITCDIPKDYLTVALKSIQDNMMHEYSFHEKSNLKEALNDMDIDARDMNKLEEQFCKDYIDALNSVNVDDSFEVYVDFVVNWLKDFCSLEMKTVKDRDLDGLRNVLMEFNVEAALKTFVKFQ